MLVAAVDIPVVADDVEGVDDDDVDDEVVDDLISELPEFDIVTDVLPVVVPIDGIVNTVRFKQCTQYNSLPLVNTVFIHFKQK